jgi:beta-lactamase class A
MAQDLRQGFRSGFTGSTGAGGELRQALRRLGHQNSFPAGRDERHARAVQYIAAENVPLVSESVPAHNKMHMPRSLFPVLIGLALIAVACGGSGEEDEDTRVLIGGPTAQPTATPEPEALGASSTPQATAPDPTRSPSVVSLDWLAGEAQMPGLPSFAPPQPDPGLAGAIQAALAGAPGRASVVVHNLRDGRYAAFNENETYYAASLFKLGIMYEAYRQRDAGVLDFGRYLTLSPEYAAYDLGTMGPLGLHPGDMLTVFDAIQAMAVASDTPTGVLLQNTVGCDTADQTLLSIGVQGTEFCNSALPATAAGMTTLVEAVAGGVGVSDASRNEMLSLMSQEYYKQGIIAGVPAGNLIAHKTGSYSGATHDVAIVWGLAGPYSIAVMTDQPSNWSTIAAVSAAVWSYFGANLG